MNQWNKIFDGLFGGAGSAFGGYLEGKSKSDAQQTYELAMKNVKDAAMKLSSGQDQVQSDAGLNGTGQVESPEMQMQKIFGGFDANTPLETNIGTMQPQGVDQNNIAPVIPPRVGSSPGGNETDPMALVNAYFKGVGELTKLGDYGKPYLNPLEDLYKNVAPKKKEIKTDVTNGYVIKYDDQGNILKKTKIDDLPKPEKNTVEKYSKMTLEDAEKLTDNELSGDAFYYLPQDVQAQLMQKYPALQQMHDQKFKEGDFAPKIPGRKLGGLGKLAPIKEGLVDDQKDFEKLRDYNENVWAGKDLTAEQQDEYETLQTKLGQRYGLDYNGLAIVTEKMRNATSKKETNEIMKSLEKGDFYNDAGTDQTQIDYDRQRIQEWVSYMNDIYQAEGYGNTWNSEKQKFWQEIDAYFKRGSLTSKEYSDLKKSYQ